MRLRLPLLLVWLVLPLSGAWAAGGENCTDPAEVIVHSEDPALREEVCGAAAKAITFLALFDLTPQRPITIDIVENPIDNHGFPSYGRYESETDRIEVMSYGAIFASVEHPQMYGEPFDRVHYAGVIAHEVAHAVIEPNMQLKKFSTTPQEYLAHATQVAVLPEARRQQLIAAMNVEPWAGGDSISNIYMAMNPGKFAVKSYLHLVSLADPKDFVRLLMNTKWFEVYVPKDLARRPGT